MKKSKSILKWVLRIVIALFVIYIVTFIIVKSEVRHYLGQNTPVVDTSQLDIRSGQLAITNVSVLSTDAQSMRDSLTVLMNDGNIEYVGPAIEVPNSYHIIEGNGKYLIPGLIDTHTHLYKSKNDLLLYLVNGVTHIANMNSWNDRLYLSWREEANNRSLSPNMFIAAGGMSSKKGFMSKVRVLFGDHSGYNTPSQVREAIKKYKREGYDAVKAYNLNRDVYMAASEEAKKQNIPLIGHLPPTVSLEDLYNSNQSQVAHIEEITKATMNDFGGLGYSNTEEYLKYLTEHCDTIAQKLKEKEIVISTTIWVIESIPKQDFDLPNFLKNIPLEYQNPGIIEGSLVHSGWLPGNNRYEDPDNTDKESVQKDKLYWGTYVQALHIMTEALARNGVTLMVGTDSNTAGVIAGFSLHDELESLSKVGLSNGQILEAATVAPAQWMKTNAGKIEVGYSADLILLNKNPLEDIRNTRTINGVITNGRFLSKKILDTILQDIKEANNISREMSIDHFIDK